MKNLACNCDIFTCVFLLQTTRDGNQKYVSTDNLLLHKHICLSRNRSDMPCGWNPGISVEHRCSRSTMQLYNLLVLSVNIELIQVVIASDAQSRRLHDSTLAKCIKSKCSATNMAPLINSDMWSHFSELQYSRYGAHRFLTYVCVCLVLGTKILSTALNIHLLLILNAYSRAELFLHHRQLVPWTQLKCSN